MPKIYCPCGTPNIYELTTPKFCQACGNPFGGTQSVSQIIASVAPSKPRTAPQVQYQEPYDEEEAESIAARQAIADARRIDPKKVLSFSVQDDRQKYSLEELMSMPKMGNTGGNKKISKKEVKARYAKVQERISTVKPIHIE